MIHRSNYLTVRHRTS